MTKFKFIRNKINAREGPFNSAQNRQDMIFRKMSASKKLEIASKLTMFCLELNRSYGNNRSKKTSRKNCSDS